MAASVPPPCSADEVSTGNFEIAEFDASKKDEIGVLGASFNPCAAACTKAMKARRLTRAMSPVPADDERTAVHGRPAAGNALPIGTPTVQRRSRRRSD
jgi:hypothetical protein